MLGRFQQDKQLAWNLLSKGNYTGARSLVMRLLELDSKDTDLLIMNGCICSSLKEHEAAISAFKLAEKLDPKSVNVLYNLGLALKSAGRLTESIEYYRKAIEYKGDVAQIHNNLGTALSDNGDLIAAIKSLSKAISLEPNNHIFHYNLGNALYKRGLLNDAVKSFKKSISLNSSNMSAHNNLGNALIGLGHLEEANKHYEYVLSVNPNDFNSLSGELRILDKQKRFTEALDLVRDHLDKRVDHPGLATTFAEFSRHVNSQDDAINWLESVLTNNHHSKADKSRCLFSLAKLYDTKQEYNKAFDLYSKANALINSNYNIETYQESINSIIHHFSSDVIKKHTCFSSTSELPVFIIGMPRSGTSLVEQILSEHEKIEGGGELDDINQIHDDLLTSTRKNTIYDAIEHSNMKSVCKSANLYIKKIRTLSKSAVRVTDKMPNNFNHLGLISILFPNARIIHCKRNPLDTCISIFFQNFSGHIPYSNDLTTIALYYNEYLKLMNHWKNILDMQILEIRYEDLVSSTEETARKMIDFCGLHWDEACLEFHKSRRIVSTASYDQVRQPIYNESVDRWKNYDQHLSEINNMINMQS